MISRTFKTKTRKSRAPGSENEKDTFSTIAKHRPCHAKWTCRSMKKNTQNHETQKTLKPFNTSNYASTPRACQRRWTWYFFNHRKTLRMPRKMHVLKFIGGHRLKCLVSEWKEKNTRFACTKGKFRKWRRRDTGFAGIYRIFIILSLDTYNGTCCIVSGP